MVQSEMQEDLDHAATLTEEYEALRRDYEGMQAAHDSLKKQLELSVSEVSSARAAELVAADKLVADTDRLRVEIDAAKAHAASAHEVCIAPEISSSLHVCVCATHKSCERGCSNTNREDLKHRRRRNSNQCVCVALVHVEWHAGAQGTAGKARGAV